jgi:hypothetical protein
VTKNNQKSGGTMEKRSLVKKATDKVRADNERGARINVMEELFYDFNRSRAEVYKMNFIRGIFFGFGSILGGTVLIALLAWLLGQFVNVFPPLADFINGIIQAMGRRSS